MARNTKPVPLEEKGWVITMKKISIILLLSLIHIFLGDMSSDARLNIHENYLFLAVGKDKVWLMPVDGDFGERINLAEQLAENDRDSGRYELDIAGYHGWNIYSYDGDLHTLFAYNQSITFFPLFVESVEIHRIV